MGLKNAARKSSAIFIFILIAAAIFGINLLSSKFFVRADWTADREYTLSDSTHKLLSTLQKPIKFKLYFSKDLPARLEAMQQPVEDLIAEYRLASHGKILVERVIPESSPETEQQTQAMGIPPLQINVVQKDKQEARKLYLGLVVEGEQKHEVIPVVANVSQLEYNLSAAILKVTTEKTPTLGFLESGRQSQNTSAYQYLEQALSDQVEVVKVTPEDKKLLDKKLDALLVVEPKEFPKAWSQELESLWKAGTPIVLFLGNVGVDDRLQATPYATGLEDWLFQKGITLSKELVIDPQNPGRAAFFNGFAQYLIPYPFFVKIPRQGLASQYAMTSQLEELVLPWTSAIAFEQKPEMKFEPLAESSPLSFLQEGEPLVLPEALNDLGNKPGEPHTVAALITSGKSRLVVVGNSRFVDNNTLQDYPNNVLFAQNLVDWATWGDALIGVRSRGKTDRPILMPSDDQIVIIRWVHVAGIPVMVVIVGLILGMMQKRRYRKLQENH